MRIIKYSLLPEAYNSDGKFLDKKGSVGELVYDTGMLMFSDYDKQIPSIYEMNRLFKAGNFPRAGEWTPFEISEIEYEEMIEYLLSLKLMRPFTVKGR